MLNRGALRAQIPCGLVKNWMGSRRTFIPGNGYFGGGTINSSRTQLIEKIKFIDKTGIVLTATLTVPRSTPAGLSSISKGYFGAGYSGVFSVEIDGLNFLTETSINPSATLSLNRDSVVGVNSENKGYIGAGYNETNPKVYSIVDGLKFSDETSFNLGNILALPKMLAAGVSSENRGYFGGGFDSSSTSNGMNEIDGIHFANDSYINPVAALSAGRGSLVGFNSKLKGFYASGKSSYSSSGYLNNLDTLSFDNETIVSNTSILSSEAIISAVNSEYEGLISKPNGKLGNFNFSNNTYAEIQTVLSLAWGHAGVQSGAL